jgi:3-deoxy-D-manno-octulosonate 8-phosphate phosphatase (KDO 8-P phosphatase)
VANPDVLTRARGVRVLLFDVDGVLTDGSLYLHGDGTEAKRFFIRDGTAVVLARRAGLKVGLISGRPSDATLQRASQLEFDFVHQVSSSKLAAFESVLNAAQVADAGVAYMGDDLIDVPLLRRAGFAATPADAVVEARESAHWVSAHPGGGGAVRELVEFILNAQGRWESAVQEYFNYLAAHR